MRVAIHGETKPGMVVALEFLGEGAKRMALAEHDQVSIFVPGDWQRARSPSPAACVRSLSFPLSSGTDSVPQARGGDMAGQEFFLSCHKSLGSSRVHPAADG